ncbi:hypothetical protein COCNU_09G006480 [Cocos nucifera]|uniref:Uncharacterized protein n=1 Tax=Cocos nucifera TaxID=13894 RepID=A0A8K0N7C2_COCNU|nr:hypothetical protein COCNU_09G006480 [Cocos nucifera]
MSFRVNGKLIKYIIKDELPSCIRKKIGEKESMTDASKLLTKSQVAFQLAMTSEICTNKFYISVDFYY